MEKGESPTEGIYREIFEEADLDLNLAKSVRFSGIVTWEQRRKEGNLYKGGMYAFIAELNEDNIFVGQRKKSEGILEWKKVDWICDFNNKEVAENVPYWLPEMIKNKKPKNYHCFYEDNKLIKVITRDLPKDLIL